MVLNDISEGEDEDVTDGTLTPSRDFTSTLKRRVVQVSDASYATYRAMLYFLYTGLYSFAPLASTSEPHRTSSDFSEPFVLHADYNAMEPDVISPIIQGGIPRSSAKSIYKLCDRLDIVDLKEAALDHIRCSLTSENITTEICSAFTSRYPEVRKIQNEYLKKHWKDVKLSKGFGKLISKSFGDQPDGVAEMWLEFFKQL